MHPPRPIVLVGFMGCGKSTVGPALAARLGLDFVDLDAALEAASGRTIPAWFETLGEPAFREAERLELAAVLDRATPGVVIALGGGAFAESATRALLAGRARTVWLDVPLMTIRSRIGAEGGRPLFRNEADVARLFADRHAAYAGADLRVDGEAPAGVVVERIVAGLEAPGP